MIRGGSVQDDVRWFDAIDGSMVGLVGGKGAQLGALARLHDVDVPDGFVVTTRAFHRVLGAAPEIQEALARVDDGGHGPAAVRDVVGSVHLPQDLRASIAEALVSVWAVATVRTTGIR